MSWIGVDLDGTLAKYDGWASGSIGEPIPQMVDTVKVLIEQGYEVRIFTARVSAHNIDGYDAITPIENWCEKYLGQKLKVTNIKDFSMSFLLDDRAFHVIKNTGELDRRFWEQL